LKQYFKTVICSITGIFNNTWMLKFNGATRSRTSCGLDLVRRTSI